MSIQLCQFLSAMVYKGKWCFLRTRDGKLMTIEKHPDQFKLCVTDKQNGSSNRVQLQLFEHNIRNDVVLIFWRNGACYWLTVEKPSSLKLRECQDLQGNNDFPENLPTSCRFVKKYVGTGEMYALESVEAPHLSLSITYGEEKLLSLRTNTHCLFFKDEFC